MAGCGASNLQLCLVHVSFDACKERGGQVALGGIGNHGDNNTSLGCLFGSFDGCNTKKKYVRSDHYGT